MSLIGPDQRIIPVIMFHSVGNQGLDWIFNYISEPLETFEDKIRTLVQADFHFLHWQELYEYLSFDKKNHLPAIMLTFDDGYLDNWVFVYPILKKYGAKGTIFVNPDFVDPIKRVRPNLDDVWKGEIDKHSIRTAGFLNWQEMRIMEQSGLIDIQSHALTHTWYPSGPNVIDFLSPGEKRYPWMWWNIYPAQKPFYLSDFYVTEDLFGLPVYQHEKALICKRFFPPERINNNISIFIKEKGGLAFFQQDSWRIELQKLHTKLFNKYKNEVRYETDSEYKKRVYYELQTSKKIIEENLEKQVKYICWPGGGYNTQVISLAKKVGYKAWTLSSKDQSNFRNVSGANPQTVKRIGSSVKQRWKGKDLGYTNGAEFLYTIKRHQGSLFYDFLGKWKKFQRLLKFNFKHE
jgi:peptidoglycan/xylan/chitin deacetylase (PgdA/CDA1 family)